ncbi:MAG: phosphatidate cytidylyltransferase [Nannocystaceae bacterium]
MSNLAARLATAAVLIPVLLAGILLDPTIWAVLGITVIAVAFSLDEYLRMALSDPGDPAPKSLRRVTVLVGVGYIAVSTLGSYTDRAAMVLAASAVSIAMVVLLRRSSLARAGRDLGACFAGLIYVPLLLATIPAYKRDFGDDGASWLVVALGIAFLSDTVAYVAGRTMGRHALYPEVSPNKTIEGSVGGLCGGVLATFGFGVCWLLPQLAWHHALFLGLLGSALGQLGDLVESALKRAFGVKDSGSLLPGHGGMLDRIDALLFVAPAVYYYVSLFVYTDAAALRCAEQIG